MGKTRSMNRKKKHDFAYGMDRIKNWSDLHHDVLILVMMQLGGVDFLAFSGVCKSWRSLAVSNRNKFMVSRPPMSIFVSIVANEDEYYLEDFEGRKFKISLPHFAAGMSCIGVTGGYLILINQKTYDCWLVNLIKRHGLHFPNAHFRIFCCHGFFRSTLVFSSSISEWVFVVLNISQEKIWFCIAGKPEWTEISTPFNIVNFHGFKGKIYALIHSQSHGVRLYGMELFPKLKLVLLKTENFTTPDFGSPRKTR
ncbi:unnamed protein product [Lactuca virosa]|uniref:F-box domain-containing protein n=1 Tax=Lactuca virosa TaxID=75947 RepID=A0AAU9ND39_9ASTR|nr:unnamed protein product [Lactuca virosa]